MQTAFLNLCANFCQILVLLHHHSQLSSISFAPRLLWGGVKSLSCAPLQLLQAAARAVLLGIQTQGSPCALGSCKTASPFTWLLHLPLLPCQRSPPAAFAAVHLPSMNWARCELLHKCHLEKPHLWKAPELSHFHPEFNTTGQNSWTVLSES